MKDKKNLVIAILVFALIVSNIATVTYANGGKMVEIFTGINLKVDGETFVPKDANGYAVDVFSYNGTTYLPLRALSEKFGKTVDWDNATKTVSIDSNSSLSDGSKTSQQKSSQNNIKPVKLTDIMPYDSQYFDILNSFIDTNGTTHKDVILLKRYSYSGGCGAEAKYKIDGKYNKFSGLFFNCNHEKEDEKSKLSIYGDDTLLYTKVIDYGEEATFEIDVTGVKELTITGKSYDEYSVWISNALLE